MKQYVKWDDVDKFLKEVTELYEYEVFENRRQFDGVYGLPRGGLVLAVMLSHKLELPLLMAPTDKSLIVDDICDSGESLVHYIRNSSSCEYKQKPLVCTMFYKENELGIVPDFHYETKDDRWIVFPWEMS